MVCWTKAGLVHYVQGNANEVQGRSHCHVFLWSNHCLYFSPYILVLSKE